MNDIQTPPGNRANYASPYLYRMAVVFLAFAWLAGGCYESSVPLAPLEQAAIDSSLFGTWLLADQKDEQAPTRMRIQPYDAHSYYVEFCCADVLQDRTEADQLRAHTVRVGDVDFANVQDLETDEAPYLFFRYERSDEGVLTLTPVADCLFADTMLATSAALYDFMRAHLQHERLYFSETLRFRKVDE